MIFKPKIKEVLQLFSISAIALITALSLNTLQAHASDIDAGELAAFVGKSSSSESTGGDSQGGTDFIPFGVGRNKTGYMCYLLNIDGSPASANAVAFSSPDFSFYTNKTTWVAKSRIGGYTVDDFDGGTAPWGCTPWGPDGIPSHQPQIEEYMLTVDGGVENAVAFINAYFGHDLAVKYGEKKAILVIETLMHFQFAEKRAGNNSSYNEATISALTNKKTQLLNMDFSKGGTSYNKLPQFLRLYGMKKSANNLSNWISNSKGNVTDTVIRQRLETVQDELLLAVNERIEELKSGGTGAKQWFSIGSNPLVGTVPELIRYKNNNFGSSITVYDSYLNDVACISEYMTAGGLGQQAGFKPWDGSTRLGRSYNGNNLLSDGQVQELAVAMMVFTAQADIQTTCDESKTAAHPAPVESTGTTTIIKNYRTKTGPSQYKDTQCLVTSNLSSQILIETEKDYQVVGWATSSSTSTIPSETWPVPSPINRGTTPTTITLDPDKGEKTLYVLLEKTEIEPEEVKDYNYKLTESSITRRVLFTKPDNRLSMTHLETHTFNWVINAHQIKCTGHTFTDACHGKHEGPHTSSCEKGCPATCTQEHPSGSHIESCSDPHYYDCGQRCTEQTAYCSGWQWHEKQLKISINNSAQDKYPTVLVSKSGWNVEVKNGHTLKHYYLNDAPFERTSTDAQSYQESNWDYICVLMRGKDKLTVAEWENAGKGSGSGNNANGDLRD